MAWILTVRKATSRAGPPARANNYKIVVKRGRSAHSGSNLEVTAQHDRRLGCMRGKISLFVLLFILLKKCIISCYSSNLAVALLNILVIIYNKINL